MKVEDRPPPKPAPARVPPKPLDESDPRAVAEELSRLVRVADDLGYVYELRRVSPTPGRLPI